MITFEREADSGIKASEHEEMTDMYEHAFPAVANFVRYAGGTFEDAKDIFHDALVIFVEKMIHDQVKIVDSEKAYILGISKHLWIKKYKKESQEVSLNEMEKEIQISDDYFPSVNNRRLLRFLKLTGKKCLDLLRAFYFQKLPARKIADDLGYLREHSASVQKYKCLEKIRNTVKEKSLTYDDFTD